MKCESEFALGSKFLEERNPVTSDLFLLCELFLVSVIEPLVRADILKPDCNACCFLSIAADEVACSLSSLNLL